METVTTATKPATALGADRFAGRGDDVYALLIAAHEGLAPEESARLNAKLVLILANAVGDIDTLRAAIERARRDAAAG
jgi:hypothetical protein